MEEDEVGADDRRRKISFDDLSHFDKTKGDYFEEISRIENEPPPPPLPRMKVVAPADSDDDVVIQGSKTLTTEFSYYNHILGANVPLMSNYDDITMARRWATFLLSAEYQTPTLLKKTNKLLLHLCLGAIGDKLLDIFKSPPDERSLVSLNLDSIKPFEPKPPPIWESDTYWADLLAGLPPSKAKMSCPIHNVCAPNLDIDQESHPVIGSLMDKEFKYFLYLARPYGGLLKDPGAKSIVALWLQTLASVTPASCLYLKGIRNDYIQALLGYLRDLKPCGLFAVVPPETALPPLAQMAKIYGKARNRSEMLNKEVEAFISAQPTPENGAFCYIAASGDLERSNLF